MANINNKNTILVIDDEYQNREMLSDFLSIKGYDIITAENGLEGLNIFKKNQLFAAIIDIKMPIMNGIECAIEIKKIDPDFPIIIVTGHVDVDYRIQIKSIGLEHLLIKPLNINDIHEVLDSFKVQRKEENEVGRLKNYIKLLLNNILQMEDRFQNQYITETENISLKFRNIIGSFIHDMKSEFSQIGFSLKKLKGISEGSEEALNEIDVINRGLIYNQLSITKLFNYLEIGEKVNRSVNLNQVIKELESTIKPRLPANIKLKFKNKLHKNDTFINSNHDQLLLVLLELIRNAIDVLEKKNSIIGILVSKRNGRIKISITDNGPGIPKNIQKDLFKIEVPSKNSSGIGLLISKNIVNTWDGELFLESTSKKGSKFTLILFEWNNDEDL
jgi:signal transduction histidine kinase